MHAIITVTKTNRGDIVKEVRCHNADEFTIAITKVHSLNRPRTDSEKWKRNEEYLELLDKSPQMWVDLVEQNKNIYSRLGYLDLNIHKDLTVERKKLNRGRPKKDKTRQYMLNVRLDEELYLKLKNYCNTNNKTESEAIREMVSRIH